MFGNYVEYSISIMNVLHDNPSHPSRSYADALRHRLRQSAGNMRRSHAQRASQRNPRPARIKGRVRTLSPEQAVSVLSNRQVEGSKVSTNKTAQLHGNLCYTTGENNPTAGRDTTHRTGDGDELSV